LEFILAFEDNFESSPRNLTGSIVRVKDLVVYHLNHWTARTNARHRLVGLRRGNARYCLKDFATRLPPAGLHTSILFRNRRRHNNCSNLRQRRRENTANGPSS
jgi:hypothetical protein